MHFLKKIKNFLFSSKSAKTKPGAPFRHIHTPELLKEACRAVAACPWAAVDTEGDSLHRYEEKLSLLQVSVKAGDFVIDPLAPLDLKEMADILSRKMLIFHGADFDVRILKKATPFHPVTLFDTMLAAQLLGYERFGLADLVERFYGLRLSKTAQKADWSRRPLAPELLEYAAGDTRYLERIYVEMKKELTRLGRLEWHRQACERLLRSLNEPREAKIDPLRWQLRGSKELSGRALTYLKELWAWRESEARRMDRPTFKVFNTDALLALARWADQHRGEDVASWKEAPRNVHRQHREKLNSVLRDADLLPETVHEAAERTGKGRRLRKSEEDAFCRLKEVRLALAQKLKIQPSVLVTNSVLEEIVRCQPCDMESMRSIDGLLPWQAEALGPQILKIQHHKPSPASSAQTSVPGRSHHV